MNEAFVLSYLLLWGMVGLQALCLHELLRQAVWLKGLYRESDKHLHTGTPAPDFTAPLLGAEGRLSTRELRGHKSMLLFVSPFEARLPYYQTLRLAIHAMWHKADGHLYLVCHGPQAECLRLAEAHRVEGLPNQPLLVWDEQGAVAAAFQVTNTPQAVLIDPSGRVSHHGHPELSSEPEVLPVPRGAWAG